jgi:WD40 repeat protein
MSDSKVLFLTALCISLLVWMCTWWRSGPLERLVHEDSISALAFAPDGHLFVVQSNNGIADRIDDPHAYSLVVRPDGQRLATGGRDRVARIWDAADGKLLQAMAPPRLASEFKVSTMYTLAFSPDGQILASSAGDRELTYLWRVADGHLLYTIPKRSSSIVFSPDGQEIVLGGAAVQVYRVADGQYVRQFDAEGEVILSPDGQLLVVIDKGVKEGMRVFRFRDGTLLRSFPGAYGYSYSVAFSPDSQYLALVYEPGHGGGFLPIRFASQTPIDIVRVRDWRTVQRLKGHLDGVGLLAFSPDGSRLASSGSWDKMVYSWQMAPHNPLWFLVGPLSLLAVLGVGVGRWIWVRR